MKRYLYAATVPDGIFMCAAFGALSEGFDRLNPGAARPGRLAVVADRPGTGGRARWHRGPAGTGGGQAVRSVRSNNASVRLQASRAATSS
jgi:hypothetical protein